MLTTLVMTVIAVDRPGLVDLLSSAITGHHGNWLESRMARLGGHFAGLLRVQLPAGQAPAFIAAMQALEADGLSVVVHEDSGPVSAPGEGRLLEIVGHDRPGIVRQISHALARHGVNVEELTSEVASAAMSGEALFKARARVSLPTDCDPLELQRELEAIAADLIVELSFVRTG